MNDTVLLADEWNSVVFVQPFIVINNHIYLAVGGDDDY